ncbi:sensor domain-containing diguanylate cyclase [Azospira restricta]|uniref:diguanylate cyclase n=1 Tax=Azospira restricta TaxID=404405 RepID=A0A974SMG2_9RHOO|nr:diguanylate cyclase [Azospira restricta]QRJ62635.1 GGDEF domain-containing protein [Azospira restricta]
MYRPAAVLAVIRCLLLCACVLGGTAPAAADPLPLQDLSPTQALGLHAGQLREGSAPLTLEQASAERAAGRFAASTAAMLSFGIRSAPVWIHLAFANASAAPLPRRLLIENSWQDRIDVYFVGPDGTTTPLHLGDTRPQAERPVPGRHFAVDHRFAPGVTDLYLRVEAADPIVLPIYLTTPEAHAERRQAHGYRYGFLYGYLLALMGYNLLLFLGLRDRRHLAYAAFIALFVATNLAYTGHGYAYLWPDSPTVQRWVIPILMVLYATAGLVFARHFLDTPKAFPRTHRALAAATAGFLAALAAACLLFADQAAAILVAFVAVILFSLAMPALGIMAVRGRHRYSRYFLFATVASTVGTAVTTLSVLGLIPFSAFGFQAVEIGMVIDATLLALALGSRFRAIQAERQSAERLAARDPLTDLYNRRSFLELARPLWSGTRRHGHELSLIMVDIDHFKTINDTYGHAAGDDAIIAVARVLTDSVRAEDIVARWGGEEFLVLLPETPLDAAVALAERLRAGIADARIAMGGQDVRLTASLGVAASGDKESLDRLITEADHFLYQSKHSGRNQVSAEILAAAA